LKKEDHRTGHADAGGVSTAALAQDWCCWQGQFINGSSEFRSQDSQPHALQVICRAPNCVGGINDIGTADFADTSFLEERHGA
jgi:hypothetical protein